MHTPFMTSLTATNTAQSLYTLLTVWFTNAAFPIKACYVAIQLDTGAGATSLYIGNSSVSATNCGVDLSANQAQQVYAFDSNLINLKDLYVITSTGTAQINVTVVTR